jgi:hypothetical protein
MTEPATAETGPQWPKRLTEAQIADMQFDVDNTKSTSSPMGLFRQHVVLLLTDRTALLREREALRAAFIGVRNGMGCWCKTPFVNISEGRDHEERCKAVSEALGDQQQ